MVGAGLTFFNFYLKGYYYLKMREPDGLMA